MSESVPTQIKDIPKVVAKTPFLFIGVGILFLILVLIVEAYKPGLLTGPIRHALEAIGLKASA